VPETDPNSWNIRGGSRVRQGMGEIRWFLGRKTEWGKKKEGRRKIKNIESTK